MGVTIQNSPYYFGAFTGLMFPGLMLTSAGLSGGCGSSPAESSSNVVEVWDGVLTLRFEGTLDPIPFLEMAGGRVELTEGQPVDEMIVLDDEAITSFSLTSDSSEAIADSSLGAGTRRTLQGEATTSSDDRIVETLTVEFYDAYPGVAVLGRSYSCADNELNVDQVVSAHMTVGDGSTPLRLMVGPAADVAYRDESYLSIPAAGGDATT